MTALATANGVDVYEARLTFPLTGAWHVDLLVDSASALTGAVTIDLGGALTLTGTALAPGVYVETAALRVLAGAGSWQQANAPKFYQGATLGMILGELLSQGGDALSTSSDASARNIILNDYSTTSGSVGTNVRALMAYAPTGTSWRFLPDGTFWIGPETWQAFNGDYTVTDERPQEQRAEIGLVPPVLLPGQTIALTDGSTVNVNRVEAHLIARNSTARAWWQS